MARKHDPNKCSEMENQIDPIVVCVIVLKLSCRFLFYMILNLAINCENDTAPCQNKLYNIKKFQNMIMHS